MMEGNECPCQVSLLHTGSCAASSGLYYTTIIRRGDSASHINRRNILQVNISLAIHAAERTRADRALHIGDISLLQSLNISYPYTCKHSIISKHRQPSDTPSAHGANEQSKATTLVGQHAGTVLKQGATLVPAPPSQRTSIPTTSYLLSGAYQSRRGRVVGGQCSS